MKHSFGFLPTGEEVHEYTLTHGYLSLSVLDYGGIIRVLTVDNRDIVAGFDTLDGYLADDSYQGAFIGRYANRIRGGAFTLGDTRYAIDQNENGKNHLHGGFCGFSKKLLTPTAVSESSITLSLESPNGECGYPGNMTASVTYTLVDNALRIDYTAVCDKDTPVNLTNHAYFNLNGHGSGSIADHTVMIAADSVTEVDGELLPTGRNIPVENTVFDLRTPKKLGDALATGFSGYDHNFNLIKTAPEAIAGISLPLVACVEVATLKMRLYTDRPAVQLYIGNALTGEPPMKGGVKKTPHTTFCLETQIAPDGPNRGEGILKAGDVYQTSTVFEIIKK